MIVAMCARVGESGFPNAKGMIFFSCQMMLRFDRSWRDRAGGMILNKLAATLLGSTALTG